ncbi:MAG: 3-isopropylmalate dehydrogenase [Rhodothermales bacterium]|nr:3-isopropylmalate dehydrogenase [Rhodothermales bacterium]
MQSRRTYTIGVLPGDGIGPEVTDASLQVLQTVAAQHGLGLSIKEYPMGGAAIDATGVPLPDETLTGCLASDAVLLGAVGGPRWDHLKGAQRPEAGLLGLRKGLGTYANLRPVTVPKALTRLSPLRPERVEGVDLLIVRELTGGIYFGKPRQEGRESASDTMVYSRKEVERIARVAAEWAVKRGSRLSSVDKANVLASSRLWRRTVEELMRKDFPNIEFDQLYVDNAAMQIVRSPRQFDVILTGNLFGDILSDLAATLPGSLGVLPSASIGEGVGLFEPVHGSAPDLAGSGSANPVGMILSVAMMLDHLGESEAAASVRSGVGSALNDGFLTADLAHDLPAVGTREMTEAICKRAAIPADVN